MPTMARVRKAMLEQIPQDTNGRIVELGSGWGGIAFAAARAHPNCAVTGIEFAVLPLVCCKIRQLFTPSLRNIAFIRRDFFDISFYDVTVVLCYLSNPHMEKLKQKFERELPDGALIISSTFFIPGWDPVAVKDLEGVWNTRLYIYRKKS